MFKTLRNDKNDTLFVQKQQIKCRFLTLDCESAIVCFLKKVYRTKEKAPFGRQFKIVKAQTSRRTRGAVKSRFDKLLLNEVVVNERVSG